MGIFDTVITLTALGVGAYFTVYYLIPALNQLNANAQTPAPAAAAPYVPPPVTETPPPADDAIPPPEPIADEPLEDTITDEEISDLGDEVKKLKDLVDENEGKKKPKEEAATKPKTTSTKKKGGSTVENEAAPKGKKLPKGGSVIENEAAYASVLDIYRNL